MKNGISAIWSGAGPLAISVIWLLLAQFACVMAWHAEMVTRQGALIHWLIIGVLPPALALWTTERPVEER